MFADDPTVGQVVLVYMVPVALVELPEIRLKPYIAKWSLEEITPEKMYTTYQAGI